MYVVLNSTDLVTGHVLTYLPARDLKTMRLVNRLLAKVGRENIFWSELCRFKWSEKLCLETLPMPHPTGPEPDEMEDEKMEAKVEIPFEEYIQSMKSFEDHTFDEFKPKSLHELTRFFPAFHLVEGSWMRAYNLVEQHMQIPFLHATLRNDPYSVSDTQWELYSIFKLNVDVTVAFHGTFGHLNHTVSSTPFLITGAMDGYISSRDINIGINHFTYSLSLKG
jgi:hypothetical protein